MTNIVNGEKRMTDFLGHSKDLITLSLSLSQLLTYSSLYIIKARGHPRQYTAFLASVQGKPLCLNDISRKEQIEDFGGSGFAVQNQASKKTKKQ